MNPNARNVPFWRDADAMFYASFILAVISGFLSTPANAVLTIEICGHSTYVCKEPENGVADNGSVLGKELEKVRVWDSEANQGVEVQINSSRPFPTPPGWTAPAPGSIQPTPPATAGAPTQLYTYTLPGASGGPSASQQDACAAAVAGLGAQYRLPIVVDGNCYYNYIPNGEPTGSPPTGSGWSGGASASITNVCPAGYTNSGGTCTLSNADLVQKPADGKCPIARQGNSYTTDANDPDCASSSETPAGKVNLSADGGTVTAGNSGGPTVSISTGGDGTTTVTVAQPGGGNTTVTTFKTGAPDGSGESKVNGTAQAVSPGTGTLNDGEQSLDNCGGPGQPMCSVRVDGSGVPSADAALIGAEVALQTAADLLVEKISGLGDTEKLTILGLEMPSWMPSGAECSPWTWSFKGNEKIVDWCPLLARMRALWGWFFAVLVLIYVWRSATRVNANGG